MNNTHSVRPNIIIRYSYMNPVEEIYFYNCTTQVPLPHNVLCQTSTPWNSFTTGWTKRMASTALQDSSNVAFLSTDWCAWNTPNHFIWCAQMEKNKMKWKRSCKFTVCPLSGQPFLLSSISQRQSHIYKYMGQYSQENSSHSQQSTYLMQDHEYIQ